MMGHRHTLAGRLAALGALAALALPRSAPAQTVDDFFLLSTSVPPNVILVFDNSYAMNQIEWHPAYDPTATPSCTQWNNNTTYSLRSDQKNLTYCAATGNHKRTIYAPHNPTEWDGRYLNWYFSLADNDPILAQIETASVTPASCNQAGTQTRFWQQYRRTRADATSQVFLDTICLAKPKGTRFGLANFRQPADATGLDPNGGYISVDVNSASAVAASMQAQVGNMQLLPPNSGSPLSETLFQIYTYLMPRSTTCNASNYCTPLGRDGLTRFPAYAYDKTGGVPNNSGNVLQDPVQYACQKNFIVLVTTGLARYDDYHTDPASTSQGFSSFTNLIGDYYVENEPPLPNPDVEVPGTADRRTLYLDDVVK